MIEMHLEFQEKNPELSCGYTIYRNIVSDMKISFTQLENEECEVCELFNQHNSHHTKENLD